MIYRIVLGLVVAFGFVSGIHAQDEGTAKLEKRKARMAKALMARFAKAGLSESQTEQAEEIFMKHADELIEAQKKIDAINKKIRTAIMATLSEEQQNAIAPTRRGKKGNKNKTNSVSIAINLPNMT